MRFLRYFFIAIAIAAVSCSKEETSEKMEWSADFGRLVKAYFDGKYALKRWHNIKNDDNLWWIELGGDSDSVRDADKTGKKL